MLRRDVVYFMDQSYKNKKITVKALRLALKRARDLRIKWVIVPSSTGETALKAIEIFKDSDAEVIIVSDRAGVKFTRKSYETYAKKHANLPENEIGEILDAMGLKDKDWINSGLSWSPEIMTKLRQKGVKVVVASEAFRPMLRSRVNPTFVVAQTLNSFGRGVKVAVEIVLAACDAGYIEAGKEVIALGGLSKGVDTALVVRACHRDEIFSENGKGLQIREIICKPRLK